MPASSSTVATPTDSPGAGTYGSTQTVTLSVATLGATICYTTDGSTPAATTPGTCSTGTTYSSGFSVASTATVKAIGTKAGMTNSGVLSSIYTISGGGGISIVSHVLGPAGAGTSSAIDTSGATGLYVWCAASVGVGTPTDSKGNTYTPLSMSGSAPGAQLFYVNGTPTVGSGHTFSIAGANFQSWGAIATSGMLTTSSLTTGPIQGTGVSTITPGGGSELIITVVATATAGAYSIDQGFTILDSRQFSGGVNYGGAAAILTQLSGSGVTVTWTASGSLFTSASAFGGV